MICVAISEKNPEQCIAILNEVELGEIRLDLCGYSSDDIKRVFQVPTPTIATCRPENYSLDEQYEILKTAIEAGAKYVDLEIEAPESQKNKLITVAKANGCEVIISHHDFDSTPEVNVMKRILYDCFKQGADVAKIAAKSKSSQDNARILSLYENGKRIIALGMGESGKITRLMAPLLGAEFTFASYETGKETAPGQIEYHTMKSILEQLKSL